VSSRRISVAGVLIVVVVTLLSTLVARNQARAGAATTAAGWLRVEPAVGTANGSVVVTGHSFAAGSTISVTNETSSELVCSTTAASDGTFSCSGVAHGTPGRTSVIGVGTATSTYRAIGSGQIATVGGGGIGDGGPSLQSVVTTGQAVAVDGAGNVYFADSGQNLVRRVDAVTGTITTLAGNGIGGYNGDGMPGTKAELNFPSGVAVDTHGNVFIADYSNARIREVHAGSGTISTVAGDGTTGYSGDGGPATAAQLNPIGVTVDRHGNIFIADWQNQRVREVNAATKVITTVAGNGIGGFSGDGAAATLAEFSGPDSVAVDASGNLYISDDGNERVRRVDSASGAISTIAGNGIKGFSGDNGPAIDAALAQPFGLALDSTDNVLIADSLNGRIRRVDATTGTITTVAGNGGFGDRGTGGPARSATLSVPFGVAEDKSGNFFIAQVDAQTADEVDNDIRRVDGTTGIITDLITNRSPKEGGDGGPATQARIKAALGVTVDAAGDLFVSDSSNRIREIAASTGDISTFDGNGKLSELNNPFGLALDSARNLYVADSLNERVLRIDKAGTVTIVAGNGTAGSKGDGGPATAAELNLPAGVAVDGKGDIFIWDEQNNRIREVHPNTGIITTFSSTISGGVATDGAGNLWIANGGLTKINITTGQVTPIPGMSTGNSEVATDAAGNVFVAGQTNYQVQCYDPASGAVVSVAGTGQNGYSGDGGPATSANLYQPMAIAADPSGDLFIATLWDGRVREVRKAQCA